MSRQEIKIKLGFGDQREEVTLELRDGELIPYHLDREYSVVGGRDDRVDGIAKVTGAAKYTYDRNLPKMLFGRILRSPHPNADVKSIDLSPALKMKGVHAALDLTKQFRTSSARFAGCEIAAVAADTEFIAEEAIKAIKVEYELLPHAVNTIDAMKPGAPKVGRNNQKNVLRKVRAGRGKRGESQQDRAARIEAMLADRKERFEQARKEADHVIEAEFDTPCQTHTSLETHGVVCDWNGGNMICYASTQGTFNTARELNQHIDMDNIRVFCEYVGGGFGSKFSAGREGITGGLLARETKRPVKLMLNRSEEHLAVGNRPDSIQKITMALKKDGTILGYQARVWGTPGSGSNGPGARNDGMYKLGERDKIEYAVRTNTGALRAMRAPGFPQGVYALEQMMDMAAEKLGMDPIEFRQRNDGHKIRPYEFELGAQRTDWKKKRSNKAGSDKGRVKSGIGCAGSEWFARGGGGAQVQIRIYKNGQIEARNGSQDIGTGTRTIIGMVVAEELGLKLSDIQTFIGDTRDPRGPASGGSTTAATLTPAARQSAHDAKVELLQILAEAKEWKVDDLDIQGGQLVKKKGSKYVAQMTFKEACALMTDDLVDVTSKRPRNSRTGFSGTNAGAQFAEVEVDTETGEVKVTKVCAIADAGKIINEKTSISQVRGGVIQGVSYALFENRLMDSVGGHMLNDNMETYKIAGPVDCPEIDVVLVDVANGYNSTSVMGLGEPPVIATAAAIANAVYDAIGVRVTSIPITPRKVLEALAQKEKK
ncbi:MAG: xanthine dehydrogenase family protein molybdopterin-binding subunit [Planctomycetota bacterium]